MASDLALLWLWRRPAAAAPIGPLAREPPYATDAALKSKKKKGTFKTYSLSDLQIFNGILLTVVAMLHLHFHELFIL